MHYLSKQFKKLVPLAVLSAAVAMPQMALANTGGGATVLNVAQVSYTDVSATTSYAETATSTVTVNTVVVAPTVSAPADAVVASNGTATYTYTVTSTANGSDSYAITSTNGTIVNLASNSATASGASITLGASVIVAVPGVDQITIPAGSEANIAVNDILVIGGVDYEVSVITAGTAASHNNPSATDGAAGVTTAETTTVITLIANVAGSNAVPAFGAGNVGAQVGEQGTFTVDVTGVLGGATGDGSVNTSTTVGTTPPDVTTTTFQGVNLSITKEVSTDGGVNFAGTATGNPGSALTYRITVVNTGAGSAANVVITDAMPAYTTYTAATAKLDTTAGAVTYAAAATALTDADAPGTDAYDFGVTTGLTSTLNVGTLAASGRAVLFYQVAID